MTGSSNEPLPEETGPGVVVPLDAGFFHERAYPRTPFRQAARRFVTTLAILVAGVAALIAVIGFGIGSFQGTYPTLDGQVKTCGYASVESECQLELRSSVETVFGVDLGDDVRVSELRRSGILSITYTARLEFASSAEVPIAATAVTASAGLIGKLEQDGAIAVDPIRFGKGQAARGDMADGTVVVYLRTIV
jgi:hypothetical protein